MQTQQDASSADATKQLGKQAYLSGYDAFESLMHTLARKAAERKGKAFPAFQWRTPATSCKAQNGETIASTPPLSSGAR